MLVFRASHLVLLFVLCFVQTAHASYVAGSFFDLAGKKNSAPSSSSSGSSSNSGGSQTGLRMAIGLSAGSGTTKDQQGAIASRAVNSIAIESHLGFKSRYFEPFVYGNYEYAQQATAAAIVSNTNLSGLGYIAGAGVALDFSVISLTAAYLFIGSFTPTQKTVTGQSTTYSSPLGYRFAIDWEIKSGMLLTASYRYADYSTFEQAGVKSDISSNKLSRNTAGLSLSWGF